MYKEVIVVKHARVKDISKVLSVCLFFVFFATYSWAEDLEPPELTSFSLNSRIVDVTDTSQTVEVFIGLKDPSGVETPLVSASGVDNEGSTGFAAVSLHSGSIEDGVWRAVISVSAGSPSGQWKVTIFPVSDLAFNSWGRFGPGDEYDASFAVISNTTDDTKHSYLQHHIFK